MKRATILIACLLLGGCVVDDNTAAVATYEAIAPEYLGYVEADPALSEQQKERRRTTVVTWARAIGVKDDE